MRARSLCLLALLCGLPSTACTENPARPDLPALPSISEGTSPIVGNAAGSFGVTVMARGLDFEESYALAFDREDARVGLTVAGYETGQAQFAVFDAEGRVLFSRTVDGNVIEGVESTVGRPARAEIRFQAFTGSVSLGVSGAE